MKAYREFTIKFCAYTVDNRFQVPGTAEYGADLEYKTTCLNSVLWQVSKIFSSSPFELDSDSCVVSPSLIRYQYFNDKVTYVVNFVTDSKIWPERDPITSCTRRNNLLKGESGQVWWLHHVELPDGTSFDIDEMINPVAKHIKQAVQTDFETWINSNA